MSNSVGNGSMDSVDSMDGGMDSVNWSVDSMDWGMDSVGNNRGMDSVDWVSSGVGRGRSVVGNAFIGNLSNIATVGISSVVVDHLGSAVRESNSVGSRGGVAISLFILAELGSAVVISNAVLISIGSRLVIRRLRSVARGNAKGSSHQGGQNDNSLHIVAEVV